jgi:hypothetical protein
MKTAKKQPARKIAVRHECPLSDQQRRFCEFVVGGMPAGRAYERAGYRARGDVADQAASRMLGTVKVAEHLRILRAEAARKAEFTRDDLVGFLVEVVKTPVASVGEGSRLAQKVKVDDAGMVIEMPSKIQAAKQLAEIMGWNKPQQVKVDVSEKLAEIVRRVRGS